jgi:hypothetical protein
MKIREIILEMAQDAMDKIASTKSVIASKIKDLPEDEATLRALQEIEDLLMQVSAGGRSGYIDKKLEEIDDEAVRKARKELARYIHSVSAKYEPKMREELFTMWKTDKIVNIDLLLSKKVHTFDQIFNGYSSNPLIKEFVDDVMEENSLGQGRGEFGLNVLSKRITKPGTHSVNATGSKKKKDEEEKKKGDLLINGRKIEVKTTFGGSARFTDQEVAPAEGYTEAAKNLRNFIMNVVFDRTKGLPEFKKGISVTGLNGKQAFELGQALKGSPEEKQYFDLVRKVISEVFGGDQSDKKLINKIMTAFESGDINNFLQYYSQASLLYYLGQKEDEGVLAINLNSRNFVYYQNAEDLAAVGQRLNAETFYLTNLKDKRMPYPQLEVRPTTFGERSRQEKEYAAAVAAEKEREQAMKLSPGGQEDIIGAETLPELDQELQLFISDLTDQRGINDENKVNDMYNVASQWLSRNYKKGDKLNADALFKYLVSKFPELKYTKQEPVPGPLTKAAQPKPPKEEPDELDTIQKLAGVKKPAAPGMATV